MELAHSAMTARQKAYRETYRQRIIGWYNGWLHVALIYTIGFTAMYIYGANISNVKAWEWGIVPVTFLICNFFEWALHRYIMHRPSKIAAFRAIYNRHTLMHHQFFTEEEMRFAGPHDWRVTFFPPYALATLTLISIPGAIVLGIIVSANVGWLFISTTTAMYLIYEFMHFCCHIDDGWFVRNVPFVNTIRRHHTAHHNQSIMMERNMNLTFPVMDWLFDTSDLNRGLIGTLLNGYDTRYVRTDMRKTSRTPTATGTATGGANAAPAE
jgi:Fatty acid hydroxylase superfamily